MIIVILWRVGIVSTVALCSCGDRVVDLVLCLPLLSRCRGLFVDLVPLGSSVKSEPCRPRRLLYSSTDRAGGDLRCGRQSWFVISYEIC